MKSINRDPKTLQGAEEMKMTWLFNVTFTRPDEDNANVYVVGHNAYGRTVIDLASAEAQTRESFSHLTILEIEFFSTVVKEL